MCSRATCKKCGKATWRGCGNHIEQALAGVSKSQRCTCDQTSAGSSSAKEAVSTGGFFSRRRAARDKAM